MDSAPINVSTGFGLILGRFTTEFGIQDYMNLWSFIQHQRQNCDLVGFFFLTLKLYRSQYIDYNERLESLIHDLWWSTHPWSFGGQLIHNLLVVGRCA